MKKQLEIFLSYCSSNKTIADTIDYFFSKLGIKLIRDERDIGFKESIRDFMKRIRSSDKVILLISDDYLKSVNCMYEVLELVKDDNYKDRIFPIVLNDAKIYSANDRLQYLKYWIEKYKNLEEEVKNIEDRFKSTLVEDIKLHNEICETIAEFSDVIRNMKHITL